MKHGRSRTALAALAIVPALFAGPRGNGSPSGVTAPPPALPAAALAAVKMISYFPSHDPRAAMWNDWRPDVIKRDLATIAGLNANTVRFILQPSAFGYPTPSAVKLARLAEAIRMAAAEDLHVQLTLFDIWHSYADTSGSRAWATAILDQYRGDKRIQSIELQNEIDPSDQLAMTWARWMLSFVRGASGGIPVTISSKCCIENLSRLKSALSTSPPDFYSFHYYGGDDAVPTLKQARDMVAPRALFVGETGLPSGSQSPRAPSDPAAEAAQARFFAAVENATKVLALPPAAPWILEDFAPGTLLLTTPWYEYHFGLVRTDGTEKPAATWLRNYFKVN
jgi:endo-1,4-beta-mannosidase